MAEILSYPTGALFKGLIVGDPGTHKTGSVFALAEAGWNVKIADLDGNLDILVNLAKRKIAHAKTDAQRAEAHATASRLQFASFHIDSEVRKFTERNKPKEGFRPLSAPAFLDCVKQISDWTETAGPETVLFIDSATFLCSIAARWVQGLNGTLHRAKISLPEIGVAQEELKRVLDELKGDSVACHVIVSCHIKYQAVKENQITPIPVVFPPKRQPSENPISEEFMSIKDEAPTIPFPRWLGTDMHTQIGGWFPTILGYRLFGQGAEIHTKSFNGLGVKAPHLGVKDIYYPDSGGLAQYFKDAGFLPPTSAETPT